MLNQQTPNRSFAAFLFCSLLFVSLAINGTFALANTSAQKIQIPDLGSPDVIAYDQATEENLGRAFVASLYKNFNLLDDEATNHYIRQLGHKVAGYTGSDRHFEFYVIDNDSINAFAGPNGVIGIHTGLIKSVRSEDELAAVIAHEISHVTQNHLSRRYEYASTQGNINSIATLLAAILIGMADPNAGMATLMGGMGLNMQQELKNSRMHESEADAIGIQLLHQSGYNPHAMGSFFGYLAKKNSNNSIRVPEILRTHPMSENRLAEAENRAHQLSFKPGQNHSDDFQLVKQRLIFLANTNHFQEALGSDNPKNACYQNLLAQNTQIENSCIQKQVLNAKASPLFLTAYLNNPALQTSLLINKAVLTQHSNLMLELYPNNNALLLAYANWLIKQDESQQAIKLLSRHLDFVDYPYSIYKSLSEIYAQANNLSYAHIYLASANIHSGNIARGKYYLEQAQKFADNSDSTLQSIIFSFQQSHSKLLNSIDN